MVVRETRDASGLSKREMDDGVEVLEEKVRRIRPEAVCLVGKGVWDAVERVWIKRRGRELVRTKEKGEREVRVWMARKEDWS